MRLSEVFAASLVAPLVAAHAEIPGAPKLFGLGPNNPMQKLKARNPASARRAALPEQGPHLNARQGGQNGRCGKSFGGASCAAGYCCSSAGWCGQGNDYCQAPDCLIDYGPACDANKTPSGTTTRNVPRPQLGSIQYGGAGVYSCLKPGTVAITYDDGPYIYTEQVLDQFASYGAKATFFITGINIGKGAIDSTPAWKSVIQRMYNEGHQVASHTWSHQDLSAITQSQRFDQLVKNEMAIRNIIGKFPTYMRPPYSSCNAACQADLKTLGYVISYFDVDTDDYNNVTPDKIQNAKNNWNKYIVGSNPAQDDWLGIAHDIHQQTALNLTGHMLSTLTAAGYKAVTMGECMNDPKANWYRDSTGGTPTTSTSARPTATGKTSVDGSCGGTNGYTCVGFSEGECCSQYGWCGKSTDHCGTGCNPLFGNCPGSSSSSTKPPTSSPTGKTSVDGSCGGTNGYTCVGFSEGECCSQYGWCGKSTDHCGTGCNPLFGKCGSSAGTQTSTAPKPTATLKTSVDGTCGGTTGNTCIGFSLGTCCSQHGWCGKTTDHCGTGCNPTFGTCGSSVSNSDSVISVSPSIIPSVIPSASSSLSVSSNDLSTGFPLSLTPTRGTSLQSASQSSLSVAPNPRSTITTSVRPTTTTPASTPTPTSNVSKDGKCGRSNNRQTCKGYGNKQCCGMNERCGNGAAACGLTCNRNYGDCWWF